jgi:aminoglycoside phosphotransferase family enzyme
MNAPSVEIAPADKVRFLSRAGAYGGWRQDVTRKETNMSWVFLVGDRVYKLKKPVRFPYLDFSTLARREAACRAELRLNRRLAQDVYLKLVPLTVDADGLAIDGRGAIVDWLVVMRRLDPAYMLENRLGAGAGRRDVDRLAQVLARFYRHASPVLMTSSAYRAGWRSALDFNHRILLDPRLGLPAGLVRRIERLQRRFLRVGWPMVAERVRRRRIVDAHGDLRPEHIWLNDQIRIIDCLEFSDRLRASDPLDEVSFLDLECERLGSRATGARIRRQTQWRMADRAPEPLYLFYRCYRASQRARLAIAHLLEPDPRTPEVWPWRARLYLALAAADARRLEGWLRRPAAGSATGARATGR